MDELNYLAAHAPSIPQPWFKPIVNKQEQVLISVADGKFTFGPDPNYKDYVVTETYLQWPFAWAREVLRRKDGQSTL